MAASELGKPKSIKVCEHPIEKEKEFWENKPLLIIRLPVVSLKTQSQSGQNPSFFSGNRPWLYFEGGMGHLKWIDMHDVGIKFPYIKWKVEIRFA